MIRVFIVLCAVVAVVLIALIISYFQGDAPISEMPSREPAETVTAPEEEAQGKVELLKLCEGKLERSNGESVSLEDHRGEPVLLLFWSSWCSDCKDYLQNELEQAFAAARKEGVVAHLVCREGRWGENWESAQKCLQEMNIEEETLMDVGCAVYDQIHPGAVPSIVLLDREGRVAAVTTHMPDADEFEAMLELVVSGAQKQSERFLTEMLMSDDGAIPSAYDINGGEVVRGSDILSETQGLMMIYAAREGDQALFDKVYGYVRNSMTVSGLTAWKIADGERGDVNASLDDLRIVEALMLADEKWGGYSQELSYRESALFRNTLRNGIMRDYTNLDTGKPGDAVTLCYLDVDTMEELAENSAKWTVAAEKAREILKDGVISEEFPLFYPRYNARSGKYEGDRLQMNEALVTLYHAAKAGMDCSAALDWLQAQMAAGAVYASYTPDGTPAKGYTYESTASYALIAQTALICGREDLAQAALARIEELRCFTPPYVGDLGLIEDPHHYAFDLVETLLAWQEWNVHGVRA